MRISIVKTASGYFSAYIKAWEKMIFVWIYLHCVIKKPFKYISGCTFKFFQNNIWEFSVCMLSIVMTIITCNVDIVAYKKEII